MTLDGARVNECEPSYLQPLVLGWNVSFNIPMLQILGLTRVFIFSFDE